MSGSRSHVVSSFTIIKGSLIDETYAAFSVWDLEASKKANLEKIKSENTIGARSTAWLRDVVFVLSRRFEPEERDRALVELAKAGASQEMWRPLMLWHMTRDEFLVRDFLVHWLSPQYAAGAYRIRTSDVVDYLEGLSKQKGISWSGKWTDATTSRVASGLLRLAEDFGLLSGTQVREFTSFYLPEESFLYLLHAMAETEPNARKIVQAEDWRMFQMDPADVERELLRLHQFRKLHYEVAGSLAQLRLPCGTAAAYAKGLCG